MAITARDIRSVEFTERLRGYNPDSVDQFLRLVAQRFDEMESEIEALEERSARAESRLADSGEDDVIRRTLVLAQRAADQAMAEARERAEALLAEAREQAARVVEDAEATARERVEAASGELRDEVERLSSERADLVASLTTLRARLEQERSTALGIYEATLEWLRSGMPDGGDAPEGDEAAADGGPLTEVYQMPFAGPAAEMGIVEAEGTAPSAARASEQPSPEQAATGSHGAEPTNEMPEAGRARGDASPAKSHRDGTIGPWDQDAENGTSAMPASDDPNATTIMPVVRIDPSVGEESTTAIDLSEAPSPSD